jgi:hypothetical protein
MIERSDIQRPLIPARFRRERGQNRIVQCLLAAALACTLVSACADKNAPPPETARQRQDRALRDPFAYGPDGEMPDPAAGRDAHTFDREGFKRDMDRFWNP